jgi:hypothetical protein
MGSYATPTLGQVNKNTPVQETSPPLQTLLALFQGIDLFISLPKAARHYHFHGTESQQQNLR